MLDISVTEFDKESSEHEYMIGKMKMATKNNGRTKKKRFIAK
jgi:hypothetical protein